VQRLIHITLETGEKLTATDGHPFKTTEGWRDAIMLKKGGKLLLKGAGEETDAESEAGERVATIKDVQTEQKIVPAYNLEVANAHTFFVGEEGVLAHNGHGAYTIHLPDGTQYHGKGGYGRAKKSARRVGRQAGFDPFAPCVNYEDWIDWDALDDDDSFRKEDERLRNDGGPENPKNHNKIWGHGKRMRGKK
jgi:hypothetical protein